MAVHFFPRFGANTAFAVTSMRILDRYIAKTIFVHTAIALLVLLALFSFFSFMDELSNVGKGHYGIAQAGQYVLLTTPKLIYQIFPIAALIGSMAGLGLLARHNELTTIRAAGVPLSRIVMSVMRIGAVMVLAVVVIGEWVAPNIERQAQVLRSIAYSDNISFKGKNGLWARDATSFVNINEITAQGKLHGVTIYEFADASHLTQITRAREGVYKKSRWVLQNVERQRMQGDRVLSESVAEEEWNTRLSPDLLNVVIVEPDTLSISGLYNYVAYLKENGLRAERYEIAFWSKIAAPFVTAVMVILALPFVFGSLRAVTAGQRIVVGLLIGIGFYLFNQVATYVTLVYELRPAVGALLPAAVFTGYAVHALRRVF